MLLNIHGQFPTTKDEPPQMSVMPRLKHPAPNQQQEQGQEQNAANSKTSANGLFKIALSVSEGPQESR